jgi:dTDP-4-dehydrorhamnose 3,5-epimerase
MDDIIQTTYLPDVLVIQPKRYSDERGFFSETWNKKLLQENGLSISFVQDNHSFSKKKGVVRGLHFQLPPKAQAKLVRVVRGKIFDVAVDLRKGSPTFGSQFGTVLSSDNWKQLFIPAGFAHGFMTLEDDTEVLYKTSEYYDPRLDRGIIWNDPDLAIKWPEVENDIILSEKDKKNPKFRDLAQVIGE